MSRSLKLRRVVPLTSAFFFVVLFGLAIGSGVGALVSHRSADLLKTEGVPVLAEVIGHDTRRTDKSTSYSLRLAFVTEAGERVEVDSTVGRSDYEALGIGARRELVYVRSDPQIVELDPGKTRRDVWFGAVIAVITGLGALVLGAWLSRRLGSARRAAVSGRVFGGKVTAVRDSKIRINSRRQFRLEWLDDEGGTGHSLMSGQARFLDLLPGTRIGLCRDPRTGRVWWDRDLFG